MLTNFTLQVQERISWIELRTFVTSPRIECCSYELTLYTRTALHKLTLQDLGRDEVVHFPTLTKANPKEKHSKRVQVEEEAIGTLGEKNGIRLCRGGGNYSVKSAHKLAVAK